MLMDDKDNCAIISFISYKSKSMARSILSEEVIAFADLLDEVITLLHWWKMGLGA